jgi:aspartate-semialdehyde dehydrogenase
MTKLPSVSIVGATGAVGREMIDVLARREFPMGELKLFASARSAGQMVETPFGAKRVETFTPAAANDTDIVFMAVSGDFAKAHAPDLAKNVRMVIDNSSAFRYQADIPLIVPEVNGAALNDARLIANPNCTTAILVVALLPLHKAFGLKRVIVSTYQAASGAGAKGMDELMDETRKAVGGECAGHEVFAHPLPFNIIPHIDSFQENGYTREEMKVVWETRKIMGLPDLAISCTAVRVPTLRAHAESVTIETERPVSLEVARAVLKEAEGVTLRDAPEAREYPMPLTASGQFDVEVGRLRKNPVFGEHGLDFFLCGDQLLKGAALNAVQIAEFAQRARKG